jgi:hypothetical protein
VSIRGMVSVFLPPGRRKVFAMQWHWNHPHINEPEAKCQRCSGTGVCAPCLGTGRAHLRETDIQDLGLDKL